VADSDRIQELRRAAVNERKRRHRERMAGALPPVPRCSKCGHQVRTDRWEGVCATCARLIGLDSRGHAPDSKRLLADAVLLEIRREAVAAASAQDQQPPGGAADCSLPGHTT
jgi:hypothetical protein